MKPPPKIIIDSIDKVSIILHQRISVVDLSHINLIHKKSHRKVALKVAGSRIELPTSGL